MAPLCECPLVFPSLHPLLHIHSGADSLYDNHNLLQSGRGTRELYSDFFLLALNWLKILSLPTFGWTQIRAGAKQKSIFREKQIRISDLPKFHSFHSIQWKKICHPWKIYHLITFWGHPGFSGKIQDFPNVKCGWFDQIGLNFTFALVVTCNLQVCYSTKRVLVELDHSDHRDSPRWS